jgi:hypothetical protein
MEISEFEVEMRLINHNNEIFRLSILDYMLPFNPDKYFESNWLKGEIGISKEGQTKVIQLEFLQIEELMHLIEWFEQMKNKVNRTSTIFEFIDPKMRFRLWKRGKIETIRFIYHSKEKDTYSWEMILNEKSVTILKGQLGEILLKYPAR